MVKKGRPLCREHGKCRRFCLFLEIIAGKGQKANQMGKKRRYIHRLPCNIIFHGNVWIDASVLQMRMLCRSDEENRGGVTKMSKAVKKKSRRMWRTMRKTLGTLFLVSALVIAAIPVDNLRAADPTGSGAGTSADEPTKERPNTERKDMKVSIATASLNETATGNWGATSIPDVLTNPGFLNGQNTPKIYKSENLNFSFVVHNIHNDAQYAVIVGYDNQNQLNNVGNQLTIPATLDAYAPYDGYSCALGGRNGEFLFYKTEMVREEVRDKDGKFLGYDDGKGGITQEKYYYLEEYHPCYFRTRDTWKDLEYVANRTDGRTSDASLFFIEGLTPQALEAKGGKLDVLAQELGIKLNDQGIPAGDENKDKWVAANEVSVERIKNIPVYYIGNQYVDEDNNIQNVVSKQKDDQGVDQIVGKGIFSTATVSSLVVEPNLVGIGNYAFAGTHISTVELSDSVVEIGNHAFSGCDSLSSFTIGANALNVVIGDHAFYNCSGLTEFDACNVLKIGDSAFEACRNLAKVNLLRPGTADESEGGAGGEAEPTISGSLSSMGYYAFSYCVALGELILPNTYSESDIRVSTFEGCTSLKHIYATGETTRVNFVDNDKYYSFRDFRQGVDSTFYFEGPKGSALENTAITNYFVFKYSDEEIYEKKIPDESSTLSADGFYALNAIFEVTRIDEGNTGKVTNVIIDSGLKNLNIPGQVGPLAVAEIAEGGFRNNTVLTNVTIPASLTKIGTEAFQGCYNLKNVLFVDPSNLTIEPNAFKTQEGNPSTATPVLNFIGPISTETVQCGSFEYAMDPANNINAGSQPANVYITYYSGWPTNLKVQYDPVTDRNTLLEYPTLTNLLEGTIVPIKDANGSITSCKVENNHYNAETYYYMTDEYQAAAINAAKKSLGIWDPAIDKISDNDSESLSTYEQEIKAATMNITLPAGIEAVNAGLFKEAEAKEKETITGKQIAPANIPQKTVTTYGLRDVPENAFENAEYLSSVALLGNIESIGKYAFKDCKNLMAASVAPNISKIDIAPFIGCDKLSHVDFQGGPNFTCDNSIIFSLNEDGTKKGLIEYLNGRGNDIIKSTETEGITEISPEAFRNTSVDSVDFSNSEFTELPYGVFQDTEGEKGLRSVVLPIKCAKIGKDAFTDSKIRSLTIPNKNCYLDDKMFGNASGNNEFTNISVLEIYSPEGGTTQSSAEGIGAKWNDYTGYFTVRFLGYDEESGDDDGYVIKIADFVTPGWPVVALEPKAEEITVPPDRAFEGWDYKEENPLVNSDMDVKAIYSKGYKVVFFDSDRRTIISEMNILPGQALTPPAFDKAGVLIDEWINEATRDILTYNDFSSLNVTEDMEFTVYKKGGSKPGDDNHGDNTGSGNNPGGNTGSGNNPGGSTGSGNNSNDPNGPGLGKHTLQVRNGSGSGYYAKDEQVIITANAPEEGMEFNGWDISPADTAIVDKTRSATIITMPDKDVAVIANYKAKDSTTGSGNGTSLHSLLVHNGSGSGSYATGAQIIITANEPGRGQTFSGWTVSPADTVVTDKTLASAIITMPDHDVAVIANFKGGTNTSTSTGSGNTSSTNTNRPNGSTGTVGGTTVVIDKNGLSNTGVVSATVNGSSDNFTIKMTESSAAAEAALKALQAEYGSLDNIKYFPMDISLYDSTGNTKITDTTGLSVSITLPLPDSLITYAGNNKVAGVVNDKLDKLTPRFTTISGVPCITFTAEHFSPYVIYVDIANLSDGTITDDTPTTGDGIHPKWFLSIGLACLSFVMFMIKDNKGAQNKGRSGKKQKVAVRARN